LSTAQRSAQVPRPLITLSILHHPKISPSTVKTLAQILCIERCEKANSRVFFATEIISSICFFVKGHLSFFHIITKII
jgi:hypothetical protein